MRAGAVASLLRRHHPSLAGGAIARLGEGDFCHAFAVDDAWVVRVAKHADAAEALRREGCLLPSLAAELPLRIPRPVHTFAGDGVDPAFAIHAMLPGPPMTRDRWDALAPARRRATAEQLGRFLVALHAVDPSRARACGLPALDVELRRMTLAVEAHLALMPRLRTAERRLVDEVLGDDAPPVAGAPAVVLHGDLSPDHVLFDPDAGEVTGIIDFGDLAIGDPAWDFVYVYEDYGLEFLARLLPTYPVPDRGALLARMQRFLELDAVGWCVRCAGMEAEMADGEDADALPEAVAYLAALRARADAPPWRVLL